MSKIYFARHGQTDWNLENKIQGSCDIELNSTGIQQAKELNLKLLEKDYSFESIYSSSQKRAIQTAEIISNRTGINLTIVAGLEEINLGEWEGLNWQQVQKKFPTEYNTWFVNRRYSIPPRGESYQQMLLRVYDSLTKMPLNKDILIVTHSAVIMCIQCLLNDVPLEEMTTFRSDNASVLCIESSEIINNEFVKRLKNNN